ncbi:hypothetical protein AA0113_g11011 [Alternaria arborescens]|uniref:Uncharacterized protein n=1 Tax=Alternaria arborescens TaxID=156630 RepID=A0A4Q4QGP1_9PLEO|nr:hypothetical protein AA0113_g11011 [Alternaria arborescens]
MLGHPSTNAASLISLDATLKVASETAKFTLLAQTTTTMLLSKQTLATQAAPPLSSIARTLTQYFFGEITLPSYLQPYGHLLMGFTGGAAAATALYSFLQRNKDDRRKIQLAVFHVVRVLQNLPNLEERMQTPEKLLAMISEEVNYMIGVHLTQSEGAATISQVKRKVETDYNARLQKEEIMKKRRMYSAAVEDEDDALFDRPGETDVQATEARVAGDVLRVVVQSPSSSIERNGSTSQELDLSYEEDLDLDMTMPDYDSPDQAQVPFSYKKPGNERSLPTSPGSDDDSNESSPVLATRPSNPTPRRSRGDAYDIHDTPASQPSRLACPRGNVISYEEDSESTLQPSNSTPRRDQVSSFEHTDTPRPKIARKANDGPGKDNHNIYSSPAFQKENPPVDEAPSTYTTTKDIPDRHKKPRAQSRPKTAVKPRSTTSLHRPPSTIAVKTEGAVDGTWPFPIREGLSPHVSPAVDTTQYRVAESRKLHKNLEGEREGRRRFKKWILTDVTVQESDEEKNSNTVRKEEKLEQPARGRVDKTLQQALELHVSAEGLTKSSEQEYAQASEEEKVDVGDTLPNFTSIHSGSDEDGEGFIASSPTGPANSSSFHEEVELPSSPSPLPTTAASPAFRQAYLPPVAKSSTPDSASSHDFLVLVAGSSPKRVIRSAAPSPPEIPRGSPSKATQPLEASQTHVEFKTPRAGRPKNVKRSKTAQTPGTRKSARVAARAQAERK